MDSEPRREQTEEEKKAQAELMLKRKAKKAQATRINKNEKIRCPCCKKNQYYDNYLVQKDLGVLVCAKCGILFIDQHKIKIIKGNIQEEKKGASIIPPGPPVPGSPIIKRG